MTIDEIYLSIAQNMVNNLPENWLSAHIDAEIEAEDAIGIKGGYEIQNTEFQSFKLRNFDRRIFNDFESLHQITTEDSENKWNRAKFTLEPTGKFNIDFEWDQALADEIERLNNE